MRVSCNAPINNKINIYFVLIWNFFLFKFKQIHCLDELELLWGKIVLLSFVRWIFIHYFYGRFTVQFVMSRKYSIKMLNRRYANCIKRDKFMGHFFFVFVVVFIMISHLSKVSISFIWIGTEEHFTFLTPHGTSCQNEINFFFLSFFFLPSSGLAYPLIAKLQIRLNYGRK